MPPTGGRGLTGRSLFIGVVVLGFAFNFKFCMKKAHFISETF
jgi:hypothetical protein